MEIVEVRSQSDSKLVLKFYAPKSAAEVVEALRDKTGQRGMLQTGRESSGGLALTGADIVTVGTYYWIVRENAAAEEFTWKGRLGAVIVALIVLGVVGQLLIMSLALPFCDYRWSCANNCYRTFISHIDGPFKLITFYTALQTAKANPQKWLRFLDFRRIATKSTARSGKNSRTDESSKEE